MPGQVELYTNNDSLKKIITKLEKTVNLRLACLHLVDATYLYDKHRFMSAMLLSLTAVIGAEMPFINLITKIDLFKSMGRPDMNLLFYGNPSGLEYMFFNEISEGQEDSSTEWQKRYSKLTKSLCELIENY